MSEEEVLRAQREQEAKIDRPRIGEHHHEGHQRALGAPDRQVAEVRPVDLPLLARQRAQTQERLRRRTRSKPRDRMAESVRMAQIAPCPAHLEESARGEPRILRPRLFDERHEFVDLRRPRDRGLRQPVLEQHAFDDVVVDAELGSDGPDRPALDRGQSNDRCLHLGVDHRSPPVVGRLRSAVEGIEAEIGADVGDAKRAPVRRGDRTG